MKTLTVVLVVTILVIHISGYLIKVPTVPIEEPGKSAPVPSRWLHVQKLMIPLFENVCEASSDPVIRRLSQEFTMNSGDYLEPEVITNLQNLMTAGFLPKGDIFSEYNPEHMKELKIIYEVLYSATDFDAFYKTAAWARQNLNCGLYVNAIYMAIQSRKDTERLFMPAPYEILPNYFVRKDVLIQASSIFVGQEITPTEGVREEGNAYYLDANYTAMFYDNDDDSKLAYFREDIGLNSYYFLRKLRLSPWLNNDINSTYGENLYQMMKQFMARYNLERYANGLPEIDGINWNSLPDIPYDPELIYSDGHEFIHRTLPLELTVNEDVTLLQTIENNIVAVVSHMRQSGYNKTQILNHLMEILVTGHRSYETLARQLLGKDRTNNGHVSVLEHYMTSLRDPMFWKINKNIVDLVDSALKMLPPYSRNELYFPGVEVVNIDVKKMMTAYDYFEFDVTNALKIEDSDSTFDVKIGQPRLNHKPFIIKVNISSLVAKKGLAKIYLGPKLMPGELATKKNLFTLLDMFEVNLKVGTNIISRTSDDMKHFSADFMSLKTIRKKVLDAEFGLDSLPLQTNESQIGYPFRLILPKGLSQGLPIQIFVFVAPFAKTSLSESYSTNSVEFNSAILSPGFPLDLMIEDRQLFALPNAMIKYITITQKGDNKVENYGGPGVTKQWYSTSNYDPSSRPKYSADNWKSFDYNANKGSYLNNDNDSMKVNEYNVASQDTVFDKKNQDDGPKVMPHLLKSTKLNSSSKPKREELYDHEAKKVKLDKEDYSTVPLIKNHVSKEEYKDSTYLNMPRIFNSLTFDKKPFDYKEYRSKFEKKDYSNKKGDYYKYRTVKLAEEDVTVTSTISTPISDDVIFYEVENQTNKIVDKPRLLKSSKFDYSSKPYSREPFDYKAKKAEFDRKYYSSKSADLKHLTVVPEDEVAITSTIPINEDIFIDKEKQDNMNFNIPRLLQSVKFDYSSKSNRKEPFDYKAKKAEFDKKDYSAKRGDYTKYRTVTPKEEVTIASNIVVPESEENLARVILNKDTNNVDLVNEIIENSLNTAENNDPYDDDNMNESNVRDVKPSPLDKLWKRTPTVYDFLFHTVDFEDIPEIKVYE